MDTVREEEIVTEIQEDRFQDLNFTPECELFLEEGSNSRELFEKCTKHPGHDQFIPVDKLKLSDLPTDYQTDKGMETIRYLCDRTVKISINYTSKERPDTYPGTNIPYPYCDLKGNDVTQRCGSGIITFPSKYRYFESLCPCPICKESDEPMKHYSIVFVTTATHVVFDDSEAKKVIIECFYDSEEREGVRYLYGLRIDGKYDQLQRYTTDRSTIMCVSHDVDMREKLSDMESTFQLTDMSAAPSGLAISHPHGCSKSVTVGNILYYIVPRDFHSSYSYFFKKDAKYRMSPDDHVERTLHSKFPDCISEVVPGDKDPYLHVEITLPMGSQYFIRCKNQSGPWMSFPPETYFTFLHNKNVFTIPQNMEIYWGKDLLKEYWWRYMTYDTATCPGSSGAPIFNHDPVMHTVPWISHAGALGKTNRSIVATGLDIGGPAFHENDS